MRCGERCLERIHEVPLGHIPLDVGALRSLADLKQVVRSEPAHAQEHSLEVQLPFLQKMLGEFSLVPLSVGAAQTYKKF